MTEIEQQQVDDLVGTISRAFFYAYMAHSHGVSETEMLIDYDIEAAGCDVERHVQENTRRAIHAAVTAVDQNIPFHDAHHFLMQSIEQCVRKILRPSRQKKPADHALDEDQQAQQ